MALWGHYYYYSQIIEKETEVKRILVTKISQPVSGAGGRIPTHTLIQTILKLVSISRVPVYQEQMEVG